MTDIRVIPVSQHQRSRWRNGRGWTTEIHAEPSPTDWTWRLSLAESNERAEFSSFPGVDRELLLIEGVGLRLVPREGPGVLLTPGWSHRFSGDEPVIGVPVSGPTRQLNVMWRRDSVSADVTLVRGPAEASFPTWAGSAGVAIHVVTGSVRLEPDGPDLGPGGTAVVEGSDAAAITSADPATLVAILRFTPVPAPERQHP